MIITKISGKYQITVPKIIRNTLGLAEGDRLYCRYSEGQILASQQNPGPMDATIPVAIRDRFQVTLPIKKLKVRNVFSDPAVVLELTGETGFCVRSLPSSDESAFRDRRADRAKSFDAAIANQYPSPLSVKS